ncbi:MAG TPA: hypothetical protein VM261_01865 [Kofleriaceae bacterium]|nr:hypothetical protein [Kofleriaceae bacterium]
MKRMFQLLALPALFALASCQTSFQGDPHFPGGVGGCAATCAQAGLEMSGFIYSGEFSSACVCRPPRAVAPPPSYAPPAQTPAPAPVSYADDEPVMDDASAVGVIMQMREAQQRQSSAN